MAVRDPVKLRRAMQNLRGGKAFLEMALQFSDVTFEAHTTSYSTLRRIEKGTVTATDLDAEGQLCLTIFYMLHACEEPNCSLSAQEILAEGRSMLEALVGPIVA